MSEPIATSSYLTPVNTGIVIERIAIVTGFTFVQVPVATKARHTVVRAAVIIDAVTIVADLVFFNNSISTNGVNDQIVGIWTTGDGES